MLAAVAFQQRNQSAPSGNDNRPMTASGEMDGEFHRFPLDPAFLQFWYNLYDIQFFGGHLFTISSAQRLASCKGSLFSDHADSCPASQAE